VLRPRFEELSSWFEKTDTGNSQSQELGFTIQTPLTSHASIEKVSAWFLEEIYVSKNKPLLLPHTQLHSCFEEFDSTITPMSLV
jgi:hypothetical protein